jgi:hypothetical protein
MAAKKGEKRQNSGSFLTFFLQLFVVGKERLAESKT